MSEITQMDPLPNRDSSEEGIGVLDLVLVLAENIKLLILLPLCVGALALGISFLIAPTFTARATFLPPQQQQGFSSGVLQSLGALGGLAGAAGGLKNPTDQYIGFLKTNAVKDSLISRFKLQDRYHQKFQTETRAVLDRNTTITSGKDNLIVIDVDDENPAVAADIANAYIDELRRLMTKLAVTEAQQRRVFFTKQIEITKGELIKAEQALAASGVSVSALNSNPSTALEGPARLRAQVTASEVRIAAMGSYLAPGAPEFRQATAELSALRAQLAVAERARPPEVSGGSNEYIAKYREFKYQETLFELFSRQLESAKVDESRDGALIQVVDEAMPPEHKSKPKRLAVGLAAGFATGFILVIFLFVRSAFRRGKSDPLTFAKLELIKRAFSNKAGLTKSTVKL